MKEIESLHKEIEDLKKQMIILELKNTVIEMKNSVDRFNSRMQETEEIIHKWKIDQSKQQSKTVNRA